uniref:Type II secretion system protein H n=1 Tax=Candidatus Kentrum sp. LFY TaxID=2126342 RepID=A0A450UIN4_9GAMM|nr:MAG: general secretion pathway protein H [Candidatus Kentron sp. LFY]
MVLPTEIRYRIRLMINRYNAGFTLIELMIVMVIVGIATTMAMTSMGFGTSTETRTEAKRLANLIRLAIDESIITDSNIGLELTSNSYRFLRFDPDEQGTKNWQVLETDGLLRPRTLSDTMILTPLDTDSTTKMEIPTAEKSNHASWPRIFFLSSGEITPFRLSISEESGDDEYRILGEWDGSITLKAQGIEK